MIAGLGALPTVTNTRTVAVDIGITGLSLNAQTLVVVADLAARAGSDRAGVGTGLIFADAIALAFITEITGRRLFTPPGLRVT